VIATKKARGVCTADSAPSMAAHMASWAWLLLMLVGTVHGDGANAYDLYDGTLQPFSYSELQATVTSTATPSFIPPETLSHAPEAFPFDMPPLPSDFGNHVQAPAQRPPDHGYNGNPYDSDEYAQNVQTMRDWSSHNAVVERALNTDPRATAPATFVEAGSMVTTPTVGVAASESVAEVIDPIMTAARTTPIPDSGIQPSAQDFGDTVSPDADLALRDSSPNPHSIPAPSLPAASSIPPPPRFTAKKLPSASSATIGSSPSSESSTGSGLGSSPGSGSGPTSSSSGSASTPDQFSVSEESEGDESSHESGPTPISASPKPLHPCVPTGNKKTCRIAFDSNSIPWRVVTVPRLESQSSSSSSSISSNSHSGSSSSGSESGEDSTGIQEEYSSNPSIARAQRAYYSKLKELVKEKRWMAEVSRIIEEYNFKIRNVNKHAAATERELRKSRKDIVGMIKAEKQAKLQKELEAALESLQKLEATSQALNGKMQELTQTKLGLKQTITKIQRVISSSGGGGGSGSMLELQEVVKPTADEQQYADKVAANESAKKLFGSLLELVGKSGLGGRLSNTQRSRRPTISIDLDRAREEEEQESVAPADDLSSISSRAAAIAAKYAKEENDHLHTNLPLRTLSVREYKKASDDDLFLD